MDYITSSKHYPGAFSETEARLLRTIGQSGNWLPDLRCLRFVELEALEFLRYVGYIEKASFGGYKIKGIVKPATPAPSVTALLIAAGITPLRPVTECKDARKRPGAAPSWMVVLPKGAKIPASVWTRLQPGAWCNGNTYVVQLKEVA